MSWDGEGRRPVRDKQEENRTLRRLMLAILKLPSIRLLETLSLPKELYMEFVAAFSLESFKARRRKERYLVGLLRECEPEVIEALEGICKHPKEAVSVQQSKVEELRERLLKGEKEVMAEVVASYPGVDIQRLRQLVRNAKKDHGSGKTASMRNLDELLGNLIR